MAGAMVDADPARAHVVRLINAGMPLGHVAKAANVSPAAISALIQGQFAPGRPKQQTIHDDTATRLLAVAYQAPEPKATRQSKPEAGPKHGTLAGFERHRRAGDEICDLCRAARRGYEAARRERKAPDPPSLPDELTEVLLRMCRAIVLRRPAGPIRQVAAEALRVAAERQRGSQP